MNPLTRDPEVVVLQKRLKDLGLYPEPIDGDFGPKTLSSCLGALNTFAEVIGAPTQAEPELAPVKIGPSAVQLCLPLMREFEGWRSDAYWDATGKVWTIGYGTTKYPDGSKVERGDKISKTMGEGFLVNDIETIRIPAIKKALKREVTNPMMAALISLAYNIGIGGLARSTLIKKLNAGAKPSEVAAQFLVWNKSGGKTMRGLTRRREAEAELFLS